MKKFEVLLNVELNKDNALTVEAERYENRGDFVIFIDSQSQEVAAVMHRHIIAILIVKEEEDDA